MRTRAIHIGLLLGALALVSCTAFAAPYADKVMFDVRLDEQIALLDVAFGYLDALWPPASANILNSLPQSVLNQFEMYSAPSSGISVLLNPYPGMAPHIAVDVDTGQETFNPFSIRDVRFAMHKLVNRNLIVNDILQGAGEACILSVPPSAPGAYRLYRRAALLGLTDDGDEAQAIADITTAIQAVALLPTMNGRLQKVPTTDPASAVGFWWAFDGLPVTIDGLIRVDDPNARLPIGQYIAAQIRKCGIQVVEQLRDRLTCSSLAYRTDPARVEWHFCIEECNRTSTVRWWEGSLAEYYSSWRAGKYPGANVAGWWQFTDPVSEALTQQLIFGQFPSLDEYWNVMDNAAEAGLLDAVRVYLAQQTGYFAVNQSAFADRFLYGLGDGLDRWSAYTMKPALSTGVTATQRAAAGALFASAWDPVGVSGFSDPYTSNIAQLCTDPAATQAPGSGADTPILAQWMSTYRSVDFSQSPPLGMIAVPVGAVEWDSTLQAWVSTQGETAWARADYAYIPTAFHDSTVLSLLDVAAAEGFRRNWATEDFLGDPEYDSAYAAAVAPHFAHTHGAIYDWTTAKLTAFFDYNFPDLARVAAAGVPPIFAGAVDRGQGIKWTVVEALGRIVAFGAMSGIAYGFTEKAGITQVDVLNPSCVADIRAELVAMCAMQYVPAYLAHPAASMGLLPADIVAMYQDAIDFIDAHGHAYISTGGYVLDTYDPANNRITLAANLFPNYPFNPSYWLGLFGGVDMAQISGIVPSLLSTPFGYSVNIYVDEATYPDAIFQPAPPSGPDVTLVLVTPGAAHVYSATWMSSGIYQATIPLADATALPPGSYTLVAIAAPYDGLPVARVSSIQLP